MSDIIRLLPDSVANQIAAGEVIQRPSSVVKELMENAVDAGATLVQVFVSEAGKESIQVVDNGCGMSPTDARLAFERHATSKISQAADLFTLRTMGFRGEALPSIAAVAQVELRTRPEGEETGTRLCIEGSKVRLQEMTACPVGANFQVRNLFYNIPARRKFLKSNHTELSNITAEFERIALARPDVAFRLTSGETLLLSLEAGNFRQRIAGIFGRRLDSQIIPLEVETPLCRISGFIGTPEASRKKGAHQYFFVGGRYMRHPYFAKAVASAYDRLIPENDQVHFFLNFDIDPSRIDVNIHPQKTEIKFQDEREIWSILQASVRESLGRHNAVPSIDFDAGDMPDIPVFSGRTDVVQPRVEVDTSYNPFHSLPAAAASPRAVASRNAAAFPPSAAADTLSAASAPVLYDSLAPDERAGWTQTAAVPQQVGRRYILTATADGLLLVDQHRAHMRVLYDNFRRDLRLRQGTAQRLLFPQLVELPRSQTAALERILDDLAALGFDLSPLGGGSFSILSVPAGTESVDPVELIETFTGDEGIPASALADEVHHRIALVLARRSAIADGQQLDEAAMRRLVAELMASSQPAVAPDGRRAFRLLSPADLEALFS